jgi:hypothetical protein
MIDLIVIAITALMLALALVWWRWAAYRLWIEAPKYLMLHQERRFDAGTSHSGMDAKSGDPK